MHYFIVTNEGRVADGEPKRIKNKNSVRPIPIHQKLLACGFLDFLIERRKDAYKGLFNMIRSNNGKFAGQFSKYFSKKSGSKGYVQRVGVESHGEYVDGTTWRKTFHSFRHTAITALYQTDVAEEMIATVMGHKGRTEFQTQNYRARSNTDQLQKRAKTISAIDYPGVDFDGISWKSFRNVRS